MICKNCGMDNIAEDTIFCGGCQQPLADGSAVPSAGSDSGYPYPENDSTPSSEYDDDKLDLSDPIDFIMNSGQDAPCLEKSEEEPPRQETSLGEPDANSDDDFDLFKIETDMGSSSDFDAPVQPEPKKPDFSSPSTPVYDEQPTVGIKTAAPITREVNEVSATKKIKLENKTNKLVPSVSMSQPGTKKIPAIDMPRVARSKGIILLSGENLVLTGGTKVFPGDEVRIGERLFEVRPKLNNRTKTIGIIAAAAVIFALFVAYFGGFIPLGNGQLIGIVMGSSGNRHLPNRVVRLVENNKSVTTDQAGFFMFDGLASGLYTIQLLEDGQPVSEERIAVIDNEITTFTLFESKPISYKPNKSQPAVKVEKASAPVKREIDHGILKLSVSPGDSKAYLDDKSMGKGSNNYNVKPGKYILSVKKKGYKTKSRNITVKAGKTRSYDFALSKVSKGKKKTDGELAYQNEVSGNYHEALRYYDKVLAKNSKDLWAIQGKARCFHAQGFSDKAVTYYSQAAAVAAKKGDTAAQIEALTAIIEIRPNTVTAYTARGDLFFEQNDYTEAANDYETVVKLDRRNLGALYKLGNSYYYDHDYDNAIDAFVAAEELNFADPQAQVYQAKTYLMMGDKKNMKKAYQRCKELSTYASRLEFKNDTDWQKVLDALGVDE
ncbi:MAG: tetratricopeptide repeat protein [candidate division Zixibacteria bacterium]